MAWNYTSPDDHFMCSVTGPGIVNYDFSNLDRAMDLLMENGLKYAHIIF